MKPLHCFIAANEYGLYCVPYSSRKNVAPRRILAGHVWEKETIEFIRKHCGQGDVVHAGTYFGDFLPGISAYLSHGAVLWAFEPNPENASCAEITIALNGLDNVILTRAALGSWETAGQLIVGWDGRAVGGHSRIVEEEKRKKAKTITVPIVRIDAVVPEDRNVSIIQLDVEYQEIQALQGAQYTIARCEPILIVETPGEDEHIEVAEYLGKYGYDYTEDLHKNKVYRKA